jgi:hypothetical protein
LVALIQNTASFSAFAKDQEIRHWSFQLAIDSIEHSPNPILLDLYEAFIDMTCRDWQQYISPLKAENINAIQVLQPWGKTARQVIGLSARVDYKAQLPVTSNVQNNRWFATAPTPSEEMINALEERVKTQNILAQKKIEGPELYHTEITDVLQREEDADLAVRSLLQPKT